MRYWAQPWKKNLSMEEKKYYLQMATQSSSNAVVLEKDILLDYPSIIKQKKKNRVKSTQKAD